MKVLIVFSAMMVAVLARPGVLAGVHSPLVYSHLVPGAPLALDGRVVDTPEVAYAKAEHAAAHVNEKITLANEAARSADHAYAYAAPTTVLAAGSHLVQPVALATTLVAGAPIGHDGRVVDTPEVAHAKAEHAAAHVNEKIGLAHEAARSASYEAPLLVSSYPAYSAPLVQKYIY